MITKENILMFLAVGITAVVTLLAVTDASLNITEQCVQTLTIENQTFSSIQELQETVNVPTSVRETLLVEEDTVKVDTCMLEELNITGGEQ